MVQRFAIVWLSLGLTFSAAGEETATPASATSAEAEGIHWQSDLREAHRLAVEQQRPVLVVVGAKWCGPCRRLDNETFLHAELARYINTYFVPVHLDFDDDREVVELLEVEAVPTSIVLSPRAELLGRFPGFCEPVPYYENLFRAQEELIRLDAQRAVQPATATRP